MIISPGAGHPVARWMLGPAMVAGALAMAWAASRPDRWGLFVGFSALVALLGLARFQMGRVSVAEVLIWAIAARLALIWLPPVLSDDAFRYVWDGMLQTQGFNPFLYLPGDESLSAFHDEEIYGRLNSRSYHTVYPPVSQALFAFAGTFYSHGWLASYFVIKGIFALAELAGLWMMLRIFRPRNVLLYAWNPMVLVAVAAQPHGEALVVALLIGVLWTVHRRSGGWASVLLALAGLVKLLPFVFFPFLWRRFRWRGVLPGAAVTVLFTAPYFHPDLVINVASSLRLYVSLFEFNAGPYYLLKGFIWLLTGLDASKVIGPLFGIAFVVALFVLYRQDRGRRIPLRALMAWTFGLYFAFATTIHPWYLLPLLAVAVGARSVSWHWLWLSVISLGTYLLYVDGPYWEFVVLGWVGWGVLLIYRYRDALLQMVLERRGDGKARRVIDLLPALGSENMLLDLGAGEGYVGKALAKRTGASVVLADVARANRTDLPYVVFDGTHLPFSDGHFDVTILYFVLHHADAPEALLREAARVTSGFVVVAESVFETERERSRLAWLDTRINALRDMGGLDQEPPTFRRATDWKQLFRRQGLHIAAETTRGRFFHRQSYFLLRVASPKLSVTPVGTVSAKSAAHRSSYLASASSQTYSGKRRNQVS